MVSQLITELDGCQWNWRKPVFVMGATNRPDLIDACLLTPGRWALARDSPIDPSQMII
jgi:SpoVK/Ycf46/Vps4 family AAA+-type ATPase